MSTAQPLRRDPSGGWEFNTEWKEFLKDELLATPSALDTTGTGATGPSISSSRFWKLSFDTDSPASQFQDTPNPSSPLDPVFPVGAGQGLGGAAVLVLRPPSNDSTYPFGEILGGLGLKPESESLLDLLSIFDVSTRLRLRTGQVRNAVWCIPSAKPEIRLHLAFELRLTTANLKSILQTYLKKYFLPDLPDIAALGIDLDVAFCDVSWTVSKDLSLQETVTKSSLTIGCNIKAFRLALTFSSDGIQFALVNAPGVDGRWTDPFKALTQLQSLAGSIDSPVSESVRPGFFSRDLGFQLQSVQIQKRANANIEDLEFSIRFLLKLDFGGSEQLVVPISYSHPGKTWLGQISFTEDVPFHVSPFYDALLAMPSDLTAIARRLTREISLNRLFGLGSRNPPKGLPRKVTRADVVGAAEVLTFQLAFTAEAGQDGSPSADQKVPDLIWSKLEADVLIGNRTRIDAAATVLLPRASTGSSEPPSISVRLRFTTDAGWDVIGTASNIKLASLAGHFGGDKQSALSMVGNLELRYLYMRYVYTDSGEASSFVFMGDLALGQLTLRTFFQYAEVEAGKVTAAEMEKQALSATSSGKEVAGRLQSVIKGYHFEAYVGAATKGATLGSIIDSIVGADGSQLPGFLRNIDVGAADAQSSPIGLKISNQQLGNSSTTGLTFSFWIQFAGIKFVLAQLPAASQPDGTLKVKRFARISMGKLPLIQHIPLIKIVPQPFSEIQYVWNTLDLVQAEIATVNALLGTVLAQGSLGAIAMKGTSQGGNSTFSAGHHFLVLDEKGVAVIDHLFGLPDKNPVNNETGGTVAAGEPERPPTTGAVEHKSELVQVSSVGLEFKEGRWLWISMNVTVKIGPLTFALRGFGIGLNLMKLKFNDMSTLLNSVDLNWALKGAGISFDQPPLMIAGILEHEESPTATIYRGGVGLGFVPYTFVAVGEYQELKRDGYKSVFIFARLDGPLVTLAFATISGVRIGFGYNSIIRSPRIDELPKFPMLDDSGLGAGANPIKMLENFTSAGWVKPQKDAYWAAAGLTLTAFDVLAITAVALFSFRENSVSISVLASATAQMPPGVPPEMCILYLKIAMIAEMNMIDGYFRVEASVDPTSFFLVPMCKLHGGFALVYWYDPNPNAGDWVFSAGGYHPAYQRPSHYPIVERLGISFKVFGIQVEGGGYFAITPKCVMGGGYLSLSLKVGPVKASAEVEAHFFINYSPFHYIGDIRVGVQVQFKGSVGFIHIRVSARVGADLHIEGPNFGGRAHVDFYLFGFTINFGAHPAPPAAISLSQFHELVKKPGPNANPRAKDSTAQQPHLGDLKFALEDGNFPLAEDDSVDNEGVGAEWHVRGGSFQFRINCDFAISRARLLGPTGTPPVTRDGLPPFYSRPMHVSTAIESEIEVTVIKDAGNEVQGGWQLATVQKAVPKALWAPYDASVDPMKTPTRGPPPAELVTAGDGTVTLAMGVSIRAPPPKLSESKIPAFDATKARTTAAAPPFTIDLEEEQGRFLPVKPAPPSAHLDTQWKAFQKAWIQAAAKPNPAIGGAPSVPLPGPVVPAPSPPGPSPAPAPPPDPTILPSQQKLADLYASILGWDQPHADQLNKMEATSQKIAAATTPPRPPPAPAPAPSPSSPPSPAPPPPPPAAQKPWILHARLPKHLLAGFDNFYLSLPQSTERIPAAA